MCLKSVGNLFQTVTFRITLWYTILFGALTLFVFLWVYFSLTWNLEKQQDIELLTTAKEFNSLYVENGVDALQDEFQREAESRGVRSVFFQLISKTGDVEASSDMTYFRNFVKCDPILQLSHGQPVFKTIFSPCLENTATFLAFFLIFLKNKLSLTISLFFILKS